MAFPFSIQKQKIPTLGDSIDEVTVVQIVAKQGSYVQKGDVILEVESHKGNAEINAEYDGKIVKILS